jgi:hypothetical protein
MPGPTERTADMTGPAVTTLVAIGMALTGCVHGRSSQPAATPGATTTNGKNVSPPAGQEFAYRGVHLVVPADWPIRNEHTGCPPYNETGLYVVEPLRPHEGIPQCMSSPRPADGVRIGPLVGYPPTPDGEAPIINGVRLAKVDLRGGVGYRSNLGPVTNHSFWVLLPKPAVQLLFTYGSDAKSAERILSSVSVDS